MYHCAALESGGTMKIGVTLESVGAAMQRLAWHNGREGGVELELVGVDSERLITLGTINVCELIFCDGYVYIEGRVSVLSRNAYGKLWQLTEFEWELPAIEQAGRALFMREIS